MPKSSPAPRRQKSRRIYLDAHGPWPHACHLCGEPIDGYTRPCDRMSSVIHHVDGNHWNNALSNLVPMHFSCHKKAHRIEAQGRLWSTRTLSRQYRKTFLASAGPGPWTCYFCDEPITEAQGRGSDCLDVHHLDEDPRNDQATNLVPIHRKCHTRLHRTGVPRAPETRAKASAALKQRYATYGHPKTGKKVSPEALVNLRAGWTSEARAKISAAGNGRPVSAETRAKISAAQKGKPKWSPEQRAEISAKLKGKKRSPEALAKMRAYWTPEARAKQSAAHKGKTLSPEHRAKIAAANRGRKMSPEARAALVAANTGKKHSEAKMYACQYCGRELRGSHLARHERACPSRGSTDISLHEA